MAAIPTMEEEDAKRPHRERESLVALAHANCEPDEGVSHSPRNPNMQADPSASNGPSPDAAHSRRHAAAPKRLGRDEP
jgi:hypothetical protein